MFCRKCGKVIPEDSVFCPECGFKLRNSDEAKERDDEGKANNENSSSKRSTINLRSAMFTLAAISGFGALAVYFYKATLCEYALWFVYGRGTTLFFMLICICVITYVLGTFCSKEAPADNATDSAEWEKWMNEDHSDDAMKAYLQNQLESAGFDMHALEAMDKEERLQVIKRANLDPNEYESFFG